MADGESDLETDRLELDLETLFERHCSDKSSLKSKEYCSEFCKVVEEHTGRWQVPLPQLRVLRTALCCFTSATAVFPDDCQHVRYALSSLAMSFFELMLFFSKEEFREAPLKDILDSFHECHLQLLRHKNVYLQQVKQVIKVGGPWESPVLQSILGEVAVPQAEVEEYLSSEVPLFLELRLRYLQACERVQEALALAKSCLEHREAGKHLYFHQAYLTCLYKASLHEHLHKEMAEIDGRDAVEIICNTETVEKDELLLSLCKAFLSQQLHNGDMYYIWDLVFIWSRLHLRAHPSRQGFLAECHQLTDSASNVRAIFPFIKVVTEEQLGNEGVQFCVELCARALQLCDSDSDLVTRSLVCKTIAFLLPYDLEVCRACSLLVFCQERTLEAYRTVCLLYMQPDQEPHPHSSPVRTNVRFHILQLLKEGLCFDPEFWNLLTLRTHCLELISDKAMKAAMLSEIEEEDEMEYQEEFIPNNHTNDICTLHSNALQSSTYYVPEDYNPVDAKEPETQEAVNILEDAPRKKRRLKRRRRLYESDDELDFGDDPEIKYNFKLAYVDDSSKYSLRRKRPALESSTSKLPSSSQREYLSRHVKNKIRKRRGRKKKWLQELLEQTHAIKEVKTRKKVMGKKRGRRPLQKVELSYPENEVPLEEKDVEEGQEDELQQILLEQELEQEGTSSENHVAVVDVGSLGEEVQVDTGCTDVDSNVPEGLLSEPQPAAPDFTADPELDGPVLNLLVCPSEFFHNYSLNSKESDTEQPPESTAAEEQNGDSESLETTLHKLKPKLIQGKESWKDRVLRTQRYSHLRHHCIYCNKDFRGLNILRHAFSHLKKKRKPRCILCGKRFKQETFAKTHILWHIEEMCKNKASRKGSRATKPDARATPLANGTKEVPENASEGHNENVASKPSDDQPPAKKPKARHKPVKPELSREMRIIKNLRLLIKKTGVVYKRMDSSGSPITSELEVKDEQVTIKDDVVIVTDFVLRKLDKGEEGGKKQKRENGREQSTTFYLCPSETCDKVFIRLSTTLMRHAINFHIKDEKVLEKAFLLAKKKCPLCLRQMQFLQHYKDHMKLHDDPLRFFCYHTECSQRFQMHQELKEHIKTHQPFKPQCQYSDCKQLFSGLQGLFDHEWRHYTMAPSREGQEMGFHRQKPQSSEAPWKQRVKIEELWLQGSKGQKEGPKAHLDPSSPGHPAVETNGTEARTEVTVVPDHGYQDQPESVTVLENPSSADVRDFRQTLINGHEGGMGEKVTSSNGRSASSVAPDKKSKKKPASDVDQLDVKETLITTLTGEVQDKMREPHITEHKTFKPDDPTSTSFNKALFIRPPPSTYLNESLLCMRKRRLGDEEQVAPKRFYVAVKKKKEEPASEPQKDAEAEVKTRQRCTKCLASFSSQGELEKHQALNTCSALFGFDSDDDS